MAKYTKLSEIQHVLRRPETKAGSNVEKVYTKLHTFAPGAKTFEREDIRANDVIIQTFKEVLANAGDSVSKFGEITEPIQVTLDSKSYTIKNVGKIPISIDAVHKQYIPQFLFGEMYSGSNLSDNDYNNTSGGRNGIGVKLTNIFSKLFKVTCVTDGQKYVQIWTDNMSVVSEPEITKCEEENSVCIEVHPDFEKLYLTRDDRTFDRKLYLSSGHTFKQANAWQKKIKEKRKLAKAGFTQPLINLFRKMCADLSMTSKVAVCVNGETMNFDMRAYADMYALDTDNTIYYETDNVRMLIADTPNKRVAFVNGIETLSGTHIIACVGSVVAHVKRLVGSAKVTKTTVYKHISYILDIKTSEKTWSSQTKTTFEGHVNKIVLPEDKLSAIKHWRCVKNISTFLSDKKMRKFATKKTEFVELDGVLDAELAGTEKSAECSLYLVEGKSARNFVIALTGMRENVGILPLQGKPPNPSRVPFEVIANNIHIKRLQTILGLNYTAKDAKTLRYGKVVIVTDADEDGSHIKGLLLAYFEHFFPELFCAGFVHSLSTPKRTGLIAGKLVPFYSDPEFFPREEECDSVQFYKGLGSWEKEATEKLAHLNKETIYNKTKECTRIMDMAFGISNTAARKSMISEFDKNNVLLARKDKVSLGQFVKGELMEYARLSVSRAIPHIMDGLKVSQRKVLYGFSQKPYAKQTVVQWTGRISNETNYHHGDNSMSSTIIGMAATWPGANNIPLIKGFGNFGSWLDSGKDCAQARYPSAKLALEARKIFLQADSNILRSMVVEGKEVEPEFYLPIIPMVLVNGGNGVATGWSTKFPCFNPLDVTSEVRKWIRREQSKESNTVSQVSKLIPWHKGHDSPVYEKKGKFWSEGRFVWEGDKVIITQLPVLMSETKYEKKTLQHLQKRGIISGYKIRSTETERRIVLSGIAKTYVDKIGSALKLKSSLSCSYNLRTEDSDIPVHFARAEDVLFHWCKARLKWYEVRMQWLRKDLRDKVSFAESKLKFLQRVHSGEIDITSPDLKDHVPDERFMSMKLSDFTKEAKSRLTERLRVLVEKDVILRGTTACDAWLADLDKLYPE